MSLIDDANREVAKVFPPPFTRPYGITRLFMEQLTADGPVILLPDEGEGVRVARLWKVLDTFTDDEYLQGFYEEVVSQAVEVAE